MIPQIVKGKEKKHISKLLQDRFNIDLKQFMLVKQGNEKIRAFSGDLTPQELHDLAHIAKIDTTGLYICKGEKDQTYRISLDGSHILTKHVMKPKNIHEISEEEHIKWIQGEDLDTDIKPGQYIIKHKDDILGGSRSSGTKLLTSIPKERRVQEKKI